MVVTASFTQNSYSITVTVTPSGDGTVTANPTGPYHYGDTVTLTAAPNSGYSFSAWSGDLTGSETTKTVTVTDDMTATATFVTAPPSPTPISTPSPTTPTNPTAQPTSNPTSTPTTNPTPVPTQPTEHLAQPQLQHPHQRKSQAR